MPILVKRDSVSILMLLFAGTASVAALIPYMSVFIVQTLGEGPWKITVYDTTVLSLTFFVNRKFAALIKNGTRLAYLMLISICAYMIAVLSILLLWRYVSLVLITAPCFALANGAISTIYIYGRVQAQQLGWDIPKFNSLLRATTSLGWIVSPAVAFFIADIFGSRALFLSALVLSACWLALWWWMMPKDFSAPEKKPSLNGSGRSLFRENASLHMATAVCLMVAMAHMMTTGALPLFYIREANLPSFAPGLSLSIKASVEVVVILTSPLIIRYLGVYKTLCVAIILALFAFYVLANVHSLPHLVIGAFLEGLYYGLFVSVGLLYVQDSVPDQVATTTSAYMNSLFLGGLLASIMIGSIAQVSSFRSVIQLASFGAVIAFLLLILDRPSKNTGIKALR